MISFFFYFFFFFVKFFYFCYVSENCDLTLLICGYCYYCIDTDHLLLYNLIRDCLSLAESCFQPCEYF